MSNVEWKNRNLFNYKDYEFGTQASFSVSLSKPNNNNQTSPIFIRLSINSSGLHRNVNLSFQQLYVLVSSLKSFTNNWKEVIMKCNKTASLKIKEVNSDPKLISFFIINNESDFGNIVFDFGIFMSICKLLSSIIDKYLDLDSSMENEFKTDIINNRLKNIESSLSNLSLIEGKKSNEKELLEPAEMKEALDTFNQINELDQFIGGDKMDKIILEEVIEVNNYINDNESLKKIKTINSSFIEDVLKCDISNFENLILSICREPDPIQKFIDITKMSFRVKDDFKFLPNIKKNDYKSALYLGKIVFDTSLKKYIESGIKIKNNIPAIKYKVTDDSTIDNLELAYDLLLIMGYIKLTKEKLELKEDDAQINKSIVYLATRCFTDLLYMSFLNGKNCEAIKTCILSRYKLYRDNKFFKAFDEKLENYRINTINEVEMSNFLDSICSKVLNNNANSYVEDVHKQYYNSMLVKIPHFNKLSLEQIINNVIKLEVEIATNNRLDLDKFLENENPEIKRYLKSKIPLIERNVNEDSNILRIVEHFDNEIPEDLKSEFFKYIESIKYDNVDINKFDLKLFGEDIIRAIYEWNTLDNKNIQFKQFFNKCELSLSKNEILDKFLNIKPIISESIKEEPKKENNEEDWLSAITL